MLELHGTIRGRTIELERETGLRDGVPVTVRIEPATRPVDEVRRAVAALCGTWAGDDTLAGVFADIERRRTTVAPREVRFDPAS